MRRRFHRATPAGGLNGDEQAAFAAVLDSAARQLEGLAVGLRSDLLAAADTVLRGIVEGDQVLVPRKPGTAG
jgi:hypothetical protein